LFNLGVWSLSICLVGFLLFVCVEYPNIKYGELGGVPFLHENACISHLVIECILFRYYLLFLLFDLLVNGGFVGDMLRGLRKRWFCLGL